MLTLPKLYYEDNMSQKYTKYKTPSNQPKSVKYWDKIYRNSDFWFPWVALKTVAESFLPDIMAECECNKSEARHIVWSAYIAATEGDEESPMWDACGDLAIELDDYGFALYTSHLTIGSNIHDGMSEKEAKKHFVQWLRESPENPVYGKYRVTESLKIEPLKRRK